MDIEALRDYCLSKRGAEECFPFDEDTLVFKLSGKMFAAIGLSDVPISVNLKCDPDYAIELREKYPSITPGYHMNKTHWISIIIESEVTGILIKSLIDLSYDLVFNKLPKKRQEEILNIDV